MKSQKIELELQNEEVVYLTLNFGKLYQLKAKDKKTVDEYNRIMTKGIESELDNASILYTAYRCATVEETNYYDRTDFYTLLPENRVLIAEKLEALVAPKKK